MKINTTDGYSYNEETNEWLKDGNVIDQDKIVISTVFTKKGSRTTSYLRSEMNSLVEIGSITNTVDELIADLICNPNGLKVHLNILQYNVCCGTFAGWTPIDKSLSKLFGISLKKKDYKQPDGKLAFRHFVDGELDNKKDVVAYVKEAVKHPNTKFLF